MNAGQIAFAWKIRTVYGRDAILPLLQSGANSYISSPSPLHAMPSQNGALTDQQLMEQIRGRQTEALARVYDLYSTVVYSVAMRVLRDSAASEDVMQEVFLKLWQKPESFADQRGSLCGWLAVVARNRAIDRIRGGRRFENVDDMQLSNNFDLANSAERDILLAKVRVVLETMPPDQRQAVEMAFFEGHTHTEIAEQTGQPLGTVKTRIRSALTTIRKALQISA
jgi:RNA polymerase sigma-70 factor (ECF subfamily)